MKIIYDDIIYSLQNGGGISLYWSQLEAYLRHDIRLLYRNYKDNIFYKSSSVQEIKHNSFLLFERLKNIKLPEKEPFVFHSSYYRYCKNKNAVNITTVHDFVSEYFKNDIKSVIHRKQKRNAVDNSNGIIFVSENTKSDFQRFFPDYKGHQAIIYHGIVPDYKYLDIRKKNTVLFIGGRAQYKNFDYAVSLIGKLPSLRFQIVGGGPLSKREQVVLDEHIPNRYEHYKFLSNEELNVKYNEAYFLLYPSLYEGFGFPVVEAQAAGCPVVCCNVSSLPEVARDAALYISGKNMEDDLRQISLLNDKGFYKILVGKGFENHKRFSWEKCAEETLDFYQKVYQSI